MKYRDPWMENYFNSLPPAVRSLINRSKAEIASRGELMLIGEHFKINLGYADEKK